MSGCQCCRNPYGVCHTNYQCACHPKPALRTPAKPETINDDKIRHLMRRTR